MTDTDVKSEPSTPKLDLLDLDEPPDAALALFGDVFAKFRTDLDAKVRQWASSRALAAHPAVQPEDVGPGAAKGEVIYSDEEGSSAGDSDADGAPPPISKRKQRKLNRLSVAELKRLVKKPEVVEWVDVTALDPRMLVQLKSHRNTVPVPAHWAQKRDYLQGKRGIEKPLYQLPSASLLHLYRLVLTDTAQATSPIPVSRRSVTPSRTKSQGNRSRPRLESASSQRWARSTSTTRSSTTPSSSTRSRPR
jgi:hypothetical protein